ncbi:hypothetical protein CPB85DRAFT_1162686, partial [Mucidula mucida]
IGEVLYFTRLRCNGDIKTVALLALLGMPDTDLLKESSNMYWSAQHLGNQGIVCIPVKNIKTIVLVAP